MTFMSTFHSLVNESVLKVNYGQDEMWVWTTLSTHKLHERARAQSGGMPCIDLVTSTGCTLTK